MTTSLIESCRIAPPPGTVAGQSLPLAFSDICWLHFHPIRRLLFYDFPCSKQYFSKTLVPKLKESLLLTLKHYFPLAGNLVYFSDTDEKPIIRYVDGRDSVPLTIFESAGDFDSLVGNQARDADEFYNYIPQLQLVTNELSNHKLLQVFAVQVTLFPGSGICIGLANHHVVGDASSIVGFIRAWASISKLGGGEGQLDQSLPLFDKSLIKDTLGVDSIYWNQMKHIPLTSPSFPLPTKRVRATYILNPSEIKKLKDSVLTKFPNFVHLSSFVVTSAYVWTCLAKTLVSSEDEENKFVDDDEVELFLFPVDSRARLDPPVPGNYFGNCLALGLGKVRHRELVGPDGFFAAACAIAVDIKNRVSDKEKIMEGYENWISEIRSMVEKHRLFTVSGSARVDLYDADFGWGKARKMEALSIDGEKYAMSLCKSRDYEGGLEVGLSLPKVKMDAFDDLFADGLKGF